MRMIRLRMAALAAPLLLAGPAILPAQRPVPAQLASSSTADDPARAAAIEKLSDFAAKYPQSPLRANALFQLGELLVQRADARFAAAQRAVGDSGANGSAPERPDYGPAIARYRELVTRYPQFEKIDAAAYTLGTLDFATQQYADAAKMFEIVTASDSSRFGPEAYFRLGDSYFEVAATQRGAERRATFAKAAAAYEHATQNAPKDGDIYYLSLYKLGWSYYNQATAANQDEYRKAVDVFGRLVSEYDKLSPEQQARLGLRGEALQYMAVAFTQVGGAEAAQQYFASSGDSSFELAVLQRVATSLREQGEFPRAIEAYRAVIAKAPTDSLNLSLQQEIIDTYQNRLIEPDSAQAARLELVERYGPGSPWAAANPGQVAQAQQLREQALRQAGQFALARAQKGRTNAQAYATAADIYGRYMTEFATSDSAQTVNLLYGEALFGAGDYVKAGAEFDRAAYQYASGNPKVAQQAGQNAIVAFDSAFVRAKSDSTVQDSLFASVDRFVAAFGESDVAKKALIEKGRIASQSGRWDVMAQTFSTYATKYPSDPYTPQAQKLIGDALYKQGRYAEAQKQWEMAASVASTSGHRSLADSIALVRTAAAAGYADSLKSAGEYQRAAEEVYIPFADANPTSTRAPLALADAIVSYLKLDSASRARGDSAASRQARERAIDLTGRLAKQYPTFKDLVQYQLIAAQLLADLGRRDESVDLLKSAIAGNTRWEGRPDAMVRLAVTLDSLGRKQESAQAYEQFAQAYPRDARAADAQFNAAITYAEAGDTATAIRAYGTFASRFPRDARAAQAREQRVALLRVHGDTAQAASELATLCSHPTPAIKDACAARVGEREFRAGAALFPSYQALKLVIPSASQLTQAGVERASARKRRALKQMSDHFTKAIESGAPEWLSAATYYTGLAQWEYGNFLATVQLPSGLSAEAKQAAEQGATQQAQAYYDAARKSWQSLIDKAQAEAISNVWVDRARDALSGNVPATPPTSRLDDGGLRTVGGEQ